MRILFLAQRVPYPPDRGDKITTYHEVAHLARHHEVVVACLADREADLANVAPLASVATSVDAVVVRPVAARLRALAALVAGRPFTVGYFNERELHSRVAALRNAAPFDAIIVYSSGMAQFAEPYGDVPRIMQFADLDSLKWEQYAKSSPRPWSWLFQREQRLLLEYERYIATTFSHSLVCTPRELKDFKRLVPGALVSCVSNGIDLEYFQPLGMPKRANELVFTGVMDYFPNVEGVVWFCEQVLPLIRQEIRDVTFTICGSRPNPEVQALSRFPGVTVTGRVPDVRPYLEQASVCVVPLRIARGIQNKLMEAMAMGLPTVTCSAAATGIQIVPGEDVFVADSAPEFAARTLQLLHDGALRRKVGAAARACMETHYRWEQQLARLDQVLAAVTASRRGVGRQSRETSHAAGGPASR